MLNELKKENKMLALKDDATSGQQKKQTAKDDKKEEEVEVDIDFIMNDLRNDILKIFNICKEDNDVEAPTGRTIDILREIESKFQKNMKKIQYIHDNNEYYGTKVIV